MSLTPASIAETALTPLRAGELLLFAETIRMAMEQNPTSCMSDTYLQEQITALYFPAEAWTALAEGLTPEEITLTARRVLAIREQLDAICELSDAQVIQWADDTRTRLGL